jgi:hypothetical protein
MFHLLPNLLHHNSQYVVARTLRVAVRFCIICLDNQFRYHKQVLLRYHDVSAIDGTAFACLLEVAAALGSRRCAGYIHVVRRFITRSHRDDYQIGSSTPTTSYYLSYIDHLLTNMLAAENHSWAMATRASTTRMIITRGGCYMEVFLLLSDRENKPI